MREEVRTDDPTTLLDSPGLPQSLPKYLSEAEVDALLVAGAARDGQQGLFARTALEILYATGLRVSELLGLQQNALAGDAAILLVRGKGKKERMLPVGNSSPPSTWAQWAALDFTEISMGASTRWATAMSCAVASP